MPYMSLRMRALPYLGHIHLGHYEYKRNQFNPKPWSYFTKTLTANSIRPLLIDNHPSLQHGSGSEEGLLGPCVTRYFDRANGCTNILQMSCHLSKFTRSKVDPSNPCIISVAIVFVVSLGESTSWHCHRSSTHAIDHIQSLIYFRSMSKCAWNIK